MSTIEYSFDNSPIAANDTIIRNGIISFNSQTTKETATKFSIYAKNDIEIIAGALVWEHSDALYIDVLWCDELYRKKGIGSEMMTMIIAYAIDKQLTKLFVDTYAFQAQVFYQKHGFYCIGTIPEYLLGHDRIFMRKNISLD